MAVPGPWRRVSCRCSAAAWIGILALSGCGPGSGGGTGGSGGSTSSSSSTGGSTSSTGGSASSSGGSAGSGGSTSSTGGMGGSSSSSGGMGGSGGSTSGTGGMGGSSSSSGGMGGVGGGAGGQGGAGGGGTGGGSPTGGQPVWAKSYGANVFDITTDAAGAVFIAGELKNPTTGIAKLDALGAVVSTALPGSSASSVAVDAAGNLIVGNANTGFLIKLDPNGTILWQKTDGLGSGAQAVADFDAAGNVVTAISLGFPGAVDLGTGIVNGYYVIAKLTPSGAPIWIKPIPAPGVVHGSIAVDSAGNILVAGTFSGGSLNFGGGALPNNGFDDIFVAKLSPSGNHVWSKVFGSSGTDEGLAAGVDGSGDIVVGGDIGGDVDFGGGTLSPGPSGSVGVLVKLDAAGNHVWSRTSGAALSNATVSGVAVEPSGGILAGVTGAVARLDASGQPLWSSSFGGADTFVRVVAFAPDGGALVGIHAVTAFTFAGDPVSVGGAVLEFSP